jgi:bacterioferritin-associated ferredoxin
LLPDRLVMIVCSCNVFTDHDVRGTLSAGEASPRTAGQVYGCLGCARTIRRIMDDALASTAPACCQSTKNRS